MKIKIVFLTSLVCLCGVGTGHASECVGPDCNIEPISVPTPIMSGPAMIPAAPAYAVPAEYIYETPIPMRSVKMLSVKPVPADTRAPLWDGTHGEYKSRGYDKTVDWRDGVPIWDDSIVSYKDKDFSDWFLDPMPEVYMRPADDAQAMTDTEIIEIYNQNMADAAATRARVEELLSPQRPANNLWTDATTAQETATFTPKPEYTAQDMTEIVTVAFESDDGCPFETETECNIWRRKPIIRETVSPRSPKLRASKINQVINAAQCNPDITANDPLVAPLLDRYKMLMNSARACCSDGMAYSLKKAGATDGLVYKFMSDDANFYGLGARCLMMTDADLDAKYPNTATAAVAADVRNGCLCRGRQWFTAMLAPFRDTYAAAPEFAASKFNYTYTDGLQRKITVSVNNDVQNVLKQLEMCP